MSPAQQCDLSCVTVMTFIVSILLGNLPGLLGSICMMRKCRRMANKAFAVAIIWGLCQVIFMLVIIILLSQFGQQSEMAAEAATTRLFILVPCFALTSLSFRMYIWLYTNTKP